MPRRDIRWVMIVLGIAFVVLAILLLVAAAIVGSALTFGCSAASCPSEEPSLWLDWIGLPFLTLGIFLLGVGLWWAIR